MDPSRNAGAALQNPRRKSLAPQAQVTTATVSPDVSCSRGSPDDPLDVTLLACALGEYREMPGLALTFDQAQRLWGFDAVTCRRIIDALIDQGILRWSSCGLLMRVDSEP